MSSVVGLFHPGHLAETDSADIIHSHEFRSVYQPILSPTHRKLVGFEALVRVSHCGKPVAPPVLFEQATKLEQTPALDRHLLYLHLSNFAGNVDPAWLFLNVNPATCIHPDASLERLARQCQLSGVEPDKVVLELVETVAEDAGALMDFIHSAKKHGFQIAIDDFGIGDSNFERLWQIQPLIVKLDRSLLVNAEHNNRARLLLRSLVSMIRESGSLVLLEGVETGHQATIALETEADLLQGFLFAKPTNLSSALAQQAETQLHKVMTESDARSHRAIRRQEQYLRLLRLEIEEAVHQLSRGNEFNRVCERLLELDGVKRCFLLDSDGVQQGNLVHDSLDLHKGRFNPLYHSAGARWSHREYVRNAIDRPRHISSTRPYVGLPDAKRTVTLSTGVTLTHSLQVLCVDVHPDEMFNSQLSFPQTL